MKSTEYNKSQIMKTAWSLKRRSGDYSFGQCLSIAWARAKCDVMDARREQEKSKAQGLNFSFGKNPQGSFNMNALSNTLSGFYAGNRYNGD